MKLYLFFLCVFFINPIHLGQKRIKAARRKARLEAKPIELGPNKVLPIIGCICVAFASKSLTCALAATATYIAQDNRISEEVENSSSLVYAQALAGLSGAGIINYFQRLK